MPEHRSSLLPALASAVLLTVAASAHGGEGYSLTINQPQSLLTYTFNASSPFTGTMTGDPNATPPSRLRQGSAFSTTIPACAFVTNCGSVPLLTNDLLAISGSLGASASSTPGSPVRPGGSVDIEIAGSASAARNLSMNLVASGAIDLTTNLNSLSYPPFCAATGTSTSVICTLPFCGAINFPITGVSLTAFQVVQQPGVASGTLVPTGPNTFDFSIPMTVTVTPAVTFNGGPITTDPQTLPIVLSGTLTRSGGTASINGATTITFNPSPNNTPTTFPPIPFMIPATSPACAGLNVLLGTTTNGSSVDSVSTANIVAGGPRIACPCDFNHDGARSVQDIFDFLAAWFVASPAANFNGVGGVTVQDIFDFLACWFAGGFGC